MLRSIIWYTDLIISLIFMEPTNQRIKKLIQYGDITEKEELAYTTVRRWATKRIRRTGSTINVQGLENIPEDANVLYVSNHQSNFDIILILSRLPKPKGFIAKKELAKLHVLRKWMENINCLFLDRDDLKQSMQVIIDGIKLLKGGYSLVIFPEGTRSKGGPIGDFKAGSFKLAVKSNVPIIPVTINNTYKVLEANKNKIKPAIINMYIHPPIYISDLSKEDIVKLPENVKSIIASKL